MALTTPGIHHVTAIGSDPGRNLAFYTEVLGLRLVKRSVNQDDVSVYHLFYGDRSGSPGTSMTVFPYPDARPGRVGVDQVSAVSFLVPAGSIGYWRDRLDAEGIGFERSDRFDEAVLAFRDPDGLPLELVDRGDAPPGDPPAGPVPAEHAIRGFAGVTLALDDAERTTDLLGTMGFRSGGNDGSRHRYESAGDRGNVVDVIEDPDLPRGRPGAGTVHHVAFRTTEADQPGWRSVLADRGLRPTEVIDRKWFKSVYVREHSGVLFEFATEGPGYTVDERVDALGEQLVLPEWLEGRRDEIEAGLPDLTRPVDAD